MHGMATRKQKQAARENIKKAQQAWQNMSPAARSRSQPEGKERKRPGTGGSGKFYRIEVRPKSQFVTFRNHDIGREGHLERLAGQRKSGSWATAAWLVSKEDAHVRGDSLVIDDKRVREALDHLSSDITHVRDDIFKAQPRKNIPEKDKPTAKQKRARRENIKKAQAAQKQSTQTNR